MTQDNQTRPALSGDPNCDDFDDVEAAVLETARGRWFLREYARRQRNVETEEILTALERLTRRVIACEGYMTRRRRPAGGIADMSADPLSFTADPRATRTAAIEAQTQRAPCDLSERLSALREIDALDVEAKVGLFA